MKSTSDVTMAGDVGAVKRAIAQVDDGFAEGLGAEEIAQLVQTLG